MEKNAKGASRLVIVGGGIAGLSAGVYAQRCGFETTIFESHSIAGGNCTSWKRKGNVSGESYLFEGGMHWLTGSNPNDALNKVWRAVGALDDNVVIHKNDPFITYNHNGVYINIYYDVDKTEKHLCELSPEDTKEIKKMCRFVRKIKNLTMPVTDIRGVKVTKKSRLPLSLLFSAISALSVLRALSKTTRDQYISRFKHEGIRGMLRSLTTEKTGFLPFIFTLGTLTRGDGGCPQGGSLPFVERMINTFTKLGGKLLLNTAVNKIIIENGKAKGVVAGDKRFDADAVIVTADTMQMEHLFDVPPKSKWLDEMRRNVQPTMCVFVSFGINAALKKYPHNCYFKPEKPFQIGNEIYEHISFNNYANNPVYSPVGKTSLKSILPGDTYDFWKKAKEEGRYNEEKEKVANEVLAALISQMPEIEGKVDVIDVATPLTYERFCGNWKGSWMTEMVPGAKMIHYPPVIKGLEGVYFAGHRMIPPGGLPIALVSGRKAVQYLCRDTGTVFISEE